MEWDYVADRARAEGVLFYLASLENEMPERARIRKTAAAHLMTHTRLVGCVGKTLNKAGVSWLVLKGLAISERYYHDSMDRGAGDCDILVKPQDREVAQEALLEAGFQQDKDHLELFTGPQGQVDLHVSFINSERIKSRAALPEPDFDWQSHVQTIDTPAGPISVLEPALQLDYLVLHFVHHHGLIGARWLLDIALLLRRHPELIERIERLSRSSDILRYNLDTLLSGTPSNVKLNIFERTCHEAARDGTEIPALRFLLTLRDLETFNMKRAFFTETLIPSQTVANAVKPPASKKSGTLSHLHKLTNSAISLTTAFAKAIRSRAGL